MLKIVEKEVGDLRTVCITEESTDEEIFYLFNDGNKLTIDVISRSLTSEEVAAAVYYLKYFARKGKIFPHTHQEGKDV